MSIVGTKKLTTRIHQLLYMNDYSKDHLLLRVIFFYCKKLTHLITSLKKSGVSDFIERETKQIVAAGCRLISTQCGLCPLGLTSRDLVDVFISPVLTPDTAKTNKGCSCYTLRGYKELFPVQLLIYLSNSYYS